MKIFKLLFVCLLFVTFSCSKDDPKPENTVYQFKVERIDGGIIDFSSFRGKKILIVNTASNCKNTYQYEGLQRLSETYSDNLVVVGFPSNDFADQEPGTNDDIAKFCKDRFGVTFALAAKSSVTGKTGAQPQIYQWLTQKEKNGVLSAEISWNFDKFLIDENGYLVAHFDDQVQPDSQMLLNAIKR